MTSFLRLNGIAVPVALGSATLDPAAVGKNRRSANGTMNASRRLRKGGWKFSTVIKTAAEALAFRELLAGEGHVLSFDSSFYTSQGMAPTAIGAGWTLSATGPKFGAKCATSDTAATVLSYAFPTATGYTIAYYWNDAGAGYHHYVLTSAGTKWIDGVLSPGGSLLGLRDPGVYGVASFQATGGATGKLDDLVVLPYVVPSTWPAQMYAWGNTDTQPFSSLPALVADGSFIEQNTRVSVLGGDAPAGRVIYGSGTKNLHDFSFELAEV